MMHRPQPTSKEYFFDENKIIVSKTDLKGKITYCNELFIQMSGYQEFELLGKPHNIVRHPKMPKIVFKLLWDTVQSGEEINAYVINLSKDGGFYWVFANVTPSFDKNGKITNYFSVRTKPKQEALTVIEPLYAELLRLEKNGGMEASKKALDKILKEKGMPYEEFVLSL